MSREVEIGALSNWIDLVCQAGDEHVRDRVLLECVLALGSAQAAALWRPLATTSCARAEAREWRAVLARGTREVLPNADVFDALRRRALPADSVPGVRVFGSTDIALALGGVADDEALDVVEAMLVTYALMDTRSGDALLAPPLPSAPRESANARRLRHDINNVLTSLRATEDLLRHFSDGLSGGEQARFRAVVERECARVGELLASALRAEPGPIANTCAVARVVEQVLDAEQAPCLRARIQVRRFVDPGAHGEHVDLSAADMARIVQNLLVNAREALAGRTPATIWVTLERAPQTAPRRMRLVVEDDGPGLAESDRERAFTTGFTTKPGASAGQGLAIVRALAEQAGGTVRLGSRASGGSRFEVDLPAHDASQMAAPLPPDALEGP